MTTVKTAMLRSRGSHLIARFCYTVGADKTGNLVLSNFGFPENGNATLHLGSFFETHVHSPEKAMSCLEIIKHICEAQLLKAETEFENIEDCSLYSFLGMVGLTEILNASLNSPALTEEAKKKADVSFFTTGLLLQKSSAY